MDEPNPVIRAISVLLWLALCVSLALVLGSGASRYAFGTEDDLDETMLIAGGVIFVVAALVAVVLRRTGALRRTDRTKPTPGRVAFLGVTALLGFLAGIAIDIAQ